MRWGFLLSGICSCYWSGSPEGQALVGSAPFKCVSFLLLVLRPWLQRRGVLKKVGLMCLQKSVCRHLWLLRHSPRLPLSPVVVVPDLVQMCGMEWAGMALGMAALVELKSLHCLPESGCFCGPVGVSANSIHFLATLDNTHGSGSPLSP